MSDGDGPASLRILFFGGPIQTDLFDVLLQMNSRHDPDWSSRVRPLIRTRLKNGLLRVARVAQTWAGPGIGKPCDACTSVIERADTEFRGRLHRRANTTASFRLPQGLEAGAAMRVVTGPLMARDRHHAEPPPSIRRQYDLSERRWTSVSREPNFFIRVRNSGVTAVVRSHRERGGWRRRVNSRAVHSSRRRPVVAPR